MRRNYPINKKSSLTEHFKASIVSIVKMRDELVHRNKELLNCGHTSEYQNNCNVLLGITKALQKLPKIE